MTQARAAEDNALGGVREAQLRAQRLYDVVHRVAAVEEEVP